MIRLLIALNFSLIVFSASGQSFDTTYIIKGYDVYFESGSADLKEEYRQELDTLGGLDTFYQVMLEGHTDLVGSIASNHVLSQRRVESVNQYLISIGLNPNQISTFAKGESSPKVNSEKGIRENRRVSILVKETKVLRWVAGSVEDDSTKQGIKALIKIEGRKFRDSIYTNENGQFKIALPDKANYKMNVLADGYFFKERFIKVAELTPLYFEVELPRAKVGAVFDMPNFNFHGGLDVLIPKSIPTLDLLYEVLRNNNICIEIRGHVNQPNRPKSPIGSGDHILSVNRANLVLKSMINKNINPQRLVAHGYSNWEMLFPNAKSESQQAKNRRVEIRVIDCKEVHKLRQIPK